MNWHERRRQAAIARQNAFFNDYVSNLPEVGPEAIGKHGVTHIVCFHDNWCSIYDGEGCNCNPNIRFFAEPRRS
jgi:hypothetical protein